MINKQKSFTLVEILVVVVIIGLLASIILVGLRETREKARIASVFQFSRNIHRNLFLNSAGFWDFREGSGTTVRDDSEFGHHGVLGDGTCTPGNGHCPNWIDGGSPFRQVLEFDRSRQTYVDLGTFDASGNSLTITAWFKLYQQCDFSGCRIVSKATGSSVGDHYWMLAPITDNGVAKFTFRFKTDVGGTIWFISNPASLSNNVWTFVVAVYDGSYVKIYKNDAIFLGQSSKTGNIAENDSVPVWIGCNPPNRYDCFPGQITDVGIYSEALDIAQIKKLYAEGMEKYQLAQIK